jgi:hypothetical protein
MRTVAAAIVMLGSIAGPAVAESMLSCSELLRAERCAGDYVCDDDGSWQIGTMCLKDRLALPAAIAAGNGTAANEPAAARPDASVGVVAQRADRNAPLR